MHHLQTKKNTEKDNVLRNHKRGMQWQILATTLQNRWSKQMKNDGTRGLSQHSIDPQGAPVDTRHAD